MNSFLSLLQLLAPQILLVLLELGDVVAGELGDALLAILHELEDLFWVSSSASMRALDASASQGLPNLLQGITGSR